jgi:hypothetical protein
MLALATSPDRAPSPLIAIEVRIQNRASAGAGRWFLNAGPPPRRRDIPGQVD